MAGVPERDGGVVAVVTPGVPVEPVARAVTWLATSWTPATGSLGGGATWPAGEAVVRAATTAADVVAQTPTPTPTPTPTSTPTLAGEETGVQLTPRRLVDAGLVLVGAYLAARAANGLLTVAADRFATHRFRVTLLIPLVKFLLYGGAAYVVVRILFELSTAQIVAFSGLLGAALGFGLKDFLADIVGGLVVVLEQPYQVGDKVTLGGHYGEVVDIGLRSTRLVTPNDTVVVVPNFVFFNESIANANASNAEMLVVVEFFVDPDSDVSVATDVVEDALVTSPYVYVTDDHPYQVVVEDDLYYRTVKGKAYVNDLRNEIPFKTDVTERVLTAFDREGIESPKVPAGVDEPGR